MPVNESRDTRAADPPQLSTSMDEGGQFELASAGGGGRDEAADEQAVADGGDEAHGV